ncbi:MAG: PEP-CTERM sorting domain-containing protein [Methylacidiphilales bacterium]|nr:PEP-CTERM sorting domain-containing protein [Candidatus Methylacidiphilales bacterium]
MRCPLLYVSLLLGLATHTFAVIAWNEAVNGDLSSNPSAPSLISLVVGTNSVIASSGGGDHDYFTFTIGAGESLASFMLASYASSDPVAFVAIQVGSSWTAGNNTSLMIAWQHMGPGNVGNSLLGITSTTPLGPGTYTVRAQQLGAQTDYQFDLVVVPEPASLLLASIGLATLAVRRRLQGS